MKLTNKALLLKISVIFIILGVSLSSKASNKFFSEFDIEELNPKNFLEQIEKETKPKIEENKYLQLKSIEDLPKFLQHNNLNEDEGVEILTKFLIVDDLSIKKLGAIYDQTGFDGLNQDEIKASAGTDDRLIQRSKSSGNIYVSHIYFKISLEQNTRICIMKLMEQKLRIVK